jgi:3-oxoacid CoA-transferase
MSINKIYPSPAAAVEDIPDGARVAIAGFGLTHSFPSSLTVALRAHGAKDLYVVANSLGEGPYRSTSLIENHQVSKLLVCFSGRANEPRSPAEVQTAAGEIEMEMCSQGTLVERLRAGGAGIPAFYTRTSVGTTVAEGKETRIFDGQEYVLEEAVKVDYALIRAWRGDRFGNLQFKGVGANFMPSFAKAANVAIAEVDELVDVLPPDEVDFPGIFVARVVKQDTPVPTEFLAARGKQRDTAQTYNGKPGWTRDEIAEVAASMLPEPSYVNLGLGIPTLISNFTGGRDIQLHAENGIVGYGPMAAEEDFDGSIFNAAGHYVHLDEGASFFDSVTAFEMVRAGKVDVVALGAFQVDAEASFANWNTPNMVGGAIGGAMDLVASGRTVMVLMTHRDSKDRPKLVPRCTLPVTGVNCVDIVVTDLVALRWTGERFRIEKLAPGFTAQEVQDLSEIELEVPAELEDQISAAPNAASI